MILNEIVVLYITEYERDFRYQMVLSNAWMVNKRYVLEEKEKPESK